MRAILLAALLLSGCTQLDGYRAAVADRGATAADHALEDAEWYICYASSVGAVRRAYGGSQQAWQAYNDLCSQGSDAMRELPE